MHFSLPSPSHLVGRFVKSEDGTVTVAAVLWLPFFVFVLTMIFDVAMIFYGQARAHEIAAEVNRSLSVGHISTFDEAQTMVQESIASMSPNATALTTSEDYMIRTVVRMPSSDLAPVGVFASLTSFEITAVAQMVREF